MLTFNHFDKDDLSSIMEIENACHQFPWSKKIMLSCIGGRYLNVQAKDVSGETIGFYVADKVADESTLMDICIHPSFQGKGYGNALMAHYLKQVEELNVSTCFLEVRSGNTAALMMYINKGYIQTGRRTGYYPSDQGYEDAIVMSRTL